jgi:hypothetical protein
LRGWWGNPWGFESPLLHQSKLSGAQGSWAPFLFRLVVCGTRTGEGADEPEGERDFRSATARSRAAKADGVDRRG